MIGIIFDCDGTLVDSEHAHFLSWQEAFSGFGITFTKEDYVPLAGYSAAHIISVLSERFGLRAEVNKIVARKKESFLRMQSKGVPPIVRTVNFARALWEQREKLQVKLAVASAGGKKEILANLESVGLTSLFEVIVSGHDDLSHISDPTGVNKPKPYIYEHTAALLGLDPKACVAFEDTKAGVQAAVGAGILTFAVPNAYTLSQDFSKASHIISSDTEIMVDKFFSLIRTYGKKQ